jgi:DNA-directed RNA polymerase specialized sigma24 family protein
LTERQRSELVAMAARSASAVSLDATSEATDRPVDVEDPNADVEGRAQTRETEGLLERALAALPAEDAAIARLKYGEGLSLKQIREALHLDTLSTDRIDGILAALKSRFSELVAPSPRPSMSTGFLPEGS